MKDFDVGKLVISTRETEWTGKRLYEALLKEYHLQPEMAGEDHIDPLNRQVFPFPPFYMKNHLFMIDFSRYHNRDSRWI